MLDAHWPKGVCMRHSVRRRTLVEGHCGQIVDPARTESDARPQLQKGCFYDLCRKNPIGRPRPEGSERDPPDEIGLLPAP